MAKRTMSPEARARIAAAQKKRWAALRESKQTGTTPTIATKKKTTRRGKKKTATATKKTASVRGPGRRGPGRSRKAKGTGRNPFLSMTVDKLVEAKQHLDEAWAAVKHFFSRSDG